jgi:hypothetical protein
LHFAHYNLIRLNKILHVTSAMAANLTDRLWSRKDLAERTSKGNGEARHEHSGTFKSLY